MQTRPILRRLDQATVALCVLAALGCMVSYWLVYGGHQGRLIDIDRASASDIRFQIDLNHADWPEIAQLPGIGETLARRIIESRQRHGPFQDVNDLARVSGIGPKKIQRIRPFLLPDLPGPITVRRQRENPPPKFPLHSSGK